MAHQIEQMNKTSLSEYLRNESGIGVERCYQCGKCSAGCPAAMAMDLRPSVILRLLQTEERKNDIRVLQSYTIWLCLSCHTCVTRCPMDVDLPRLMDLLRSESLRQKLFHPRAKDIVAFHTSFLNTIKRFGRMWEVGMVMEYKMRTRRFLQDVFLAPLMMVKGKLSLVPPKRISVANVFRKGEGEKGA